MQLYYNTLKRLKGYIPSEAAIVQKQKPALEAGAAPILHLLISCLIPYFFFYEDATTWMSQAISLLHLLKPLSMKPLLHPSIKHLMDTSITGGWTKVCVL